VETARATVVAVGDPFPGAEHATAWLKRAGEAELAEGLAVLNRALHAHRIATVDARARGVGRADALVARLGYGAGDQVAEGIGPRRGSCSIRGHAGAARAYQRPMAGWPPF
jgi:hypothetical protein